MSLSTQAQELKEQGKLRYGDPCGQPAWNTTTAECRQKGSNLSVMVLEKFGIPITGVIPYNEYSSCCPLDIVNQDPMACIRMSLSAKLLDGEYWECYADEFGFAIFQKVLEQSSPSSDVFTLSRVQYCLPSVQAQSLADMVIVHGADPPAYRQCGDWLQIIDGGVGSIARIADLQNLFYRPMSTAAPLTGGATAGASPIMGTKFTWGQVASEGYNPGDSPTCDHGVFAQHGGIIYPDYERKQGYKDGINDIFEIGPHMQILFWMVDVDFGSEDEHYLRHYNIQFTKSTEFPVLLNVTSASDMSDYFGVTCHTGPGSTPNVLIDLREDTSSSQSCDSVALASAEGKSEPHIEWSEYTIPSFYGYGKAVSQINFADVSKWDIGSNICYDNQIDNMYESTTAILGNGAALMGFEKLRVRHLDLGPTTPVFIGIQKESQTFDIPNTNWIEIPTLSPVSDGLLTYALRAQAPHCGTYCVMDALGYRSIGIGPDSSVCWGDNVEWMNGWWNLMMTDVYHSWANGLGSMSGYLNYQWIVNELKLKRPGKLVGIGGEGLFTVDTWWSKVNISRPGLIVQGKGKDVESFLEGVKVRVMPVYLVDMPAPVAAHGNTGFSKVLDPDTDVWDNMYCTVENKTGDSELLQEASTGINLDISLPFLFPSFSTENGGGGDGSDPTNLRASFDAIGQKCYTIAKNLFGYFDSFRDEPNKSMAYICSPPRTQGEIPKLGQTVTTPYGPRTINGITFQYSDSSVYNMTVDVGYVTLNQASAGGLRNKRQRTEEVDGRIVSHDHGSLFKVRVPGIGIVNAWNSHPWPWEVGDKVRVQLYNSPMEL